MESYCSACTFKVPQGANNLILCTLDTIHRLFFVTRLIINTINKVQWVDFKLENVLVSLHSLKTMGLGSIIFKEWRVTWTFSYTEYAYNKYSVNWYIPILHKYMLHNEDKSYQCLVYSMLLLTSDMFNCCHIGGNNVHYM